MKSRINVLQADWAATREYLLGGGGVERAGFWVCGLGRLDNGFVWAVREFVPVPTEGLLEQRGDLIRVSPLFSVDLLERCREEGLSLFWLHSHPGSAPRVGFSHTDFVGEKAVMKSTYGRVDGGVHGAVVFGEESVAARWWTPDGQTETPVDTIRAMGAILRTFTPDNTPPAADGKAVEEAFDRQVRALSMEGQRRLGALKVGVVGAGGTGSLVIQLLTRLGVGVVLVVDDDVVELTNLPRIVGATSEDVRRKTPKVQVAARLAEGLPSRVVPVVGSVRDPNTTGLLRDCDVVFSCVDRHYPRAILNQFAQQYLVPVIDMGIQVQPDENGRIRSAGGRVAVVRPGSWCLSCTGDISAAAVRQEGLPSELREHEQRQGYLGPESPAAAVISLNGVVASAAVNELLHLVTGFAGEEYGQGRRIFRILEGTVFEASDQPRANCFVCRGRFKGVGDACPLP